MLLPTSYLHSVNDFKLSKGADLPTLEIAYETWGTLNEDGSNAILMCHGYTNHPHAGDADGWFSNLIGPGKSIDTDRYFVVCSNMLGSSFGTSGPQSIDPSTGKAYGPDFPKFTTRDMIEVQRTLLDHLGIEKLKAVVGYSYGGHLTFLWGALYPNRMHALVAVAGMIRRSTQPSDIATIRDKFARCPGWNGGHYQDDPVGSGVYDMMVEHRLATLGKYGLGDYLRVSLGDEAAVQSELRSRAEAWAKDFDANSLAIIYEAGIGSDVCPDVAKIKAPFLHVLSRSDSVVDIATGEPTVDLMRQAGVDARLYEIDSDYGHAAPNLDADKWSATLADFLTTHAPA